MPGRLGSGATGVFAGLVRGSCAANLIRGLGCWAGLGSFAAGDWSGGSSGWGNWNVRWFGAGSCVANLIRGLGCLAGAGRFVAGDWSGGSSGRGNWSVRGFGAGSYVANLIRGLGC